MRSTSSSCSLPPKYSSSGYDSTRQERGREHGRAPAMFRQQPLRAPRSGARIESAVRAEVARDRSEEVVRPARLCGHVGRLRVVGTLRGKPIAESRNQAARQDSLHRRPSNPDFPRRTDRCPHDRCGSDLGLEDRRYRLQPPRQLAACPIELRRVERGELHHRQAHVRSIVDQLAT